MARISLSIDAVSADDLHETLAGLLAGIKFPVVELQSVQSDNGPLAACSEARPLPVIETPVTFRRYEEPASAPVTAEPDGDAVLDAHGHPWSAALHAATKSQTKDGLWRMKPGVERPAPADGYPKTEDTSAAPTEPAPVAEVVDTPAPEPAPTSDEDEFAEFRQYQEVENAPVTPTEVPAREWSDADLSKLCNQAAKALGGENLEGLRNLIAVYVASGSVPHSRNVPVEDRERFAGEVEALANIKYEG